MDIREEIKAAVSTALADFKATLGLGSQKPAPPAVPEQPEQNNAPAPASDPAPEHPVLKAALAAGIDTPEKFAQLSAEAKAGREALPAAREEAVAAAVAYYGTNAEGLKAAKDLIAAETSVAQLHQLTERFWAGAPGANRPGKRLSQPTAPSPESQREKALAEKTSTGAGQSAGAPYDYYAQFNGPGAAKSGAPVGGH